MKRQQGRTRYMSNDGTIERTVSNLAGLSVKAGFNPFKGSWSLSFGDSNDDRI